MEEQIEKLAILLKFGVFGYSNTISPDYYFKPYAYTKNMFRLKNNECIYSKNLIALINELYPYISSIETV